MRFLCRIQISHSQVVIKAQVHCVLDCIRVTYTLSTCILEPCILEPCIKLTTIVSKWLAAKQTILGKRYNSSGQRTTATYRTHNYTHISIVVSTTGLPSSEQVTSRKCRGWDRYAIQFIYNSREEGKNHTDTEITDLSMYTIKELPNAVSTRVLS